MDRSLSYRVNTLVKGRLSSSFIGQSQVATGCLALAAALWVFYLGITHLAESPPVWWDEGWTLALAKNWLQEGYYGQINAGIEGSPGLAAAITVAGPVAIVFKILGIGVWQGRLIGLSYSLGALSLVYVLSRKYHGPRYALFGVFGLLVLFPHPMVHPILNGRQVLADLPVAFFLLAGYACWLIVAERPAWLLLIPATFWGLAIITKLQTIPFLAVGLALPAAWALFRREYSQAARVLFLAIMAFAASRWMLAFQAQLFAGQTMPSEPIPGLNQIIGLVLDPGIRKEAFVNSLVFGLPTLLGLAFALHRGLRWEQRRCALAIADLIYASMWGLAGSWMGWFLLFSNGGLRYFATPTVLAGVFLAPALGFLTAGFRLRETFRRAAQMVRRMRIDPGGVRALASLFLVLPLVLMMAGIALSLQFPVAASVNDVAHFLNTRTPPDALIESYDAELFFLLKRDYHYPPDHYHVAYLRRYLLEPELEIDYDPLTADPDYLVVGQLSADWRVYDQVLAADEFRLIETFPRYQVYERVRE